MDDYELTQIFEALQGGAPRQGWDHCDYDRVQTLEDGLTFWARQIDVANVAGAWTILPPPMVGHA